MDRREFLRKTAKLGAAAGAAAITGDFNKIFAAENENKPIDLAAIRGGGPGEMFKKGIKSMGGMKKYVKKGQTVVVKPNIGWNVPPKHAGNTNPELVSAVVKECLSAGAKKVYVFDHTCDSWRKTYVTSGIKAAAKKAGALVVPGSRRSDYVKVRVPGAKVIPTQLVHKLIVQADVFINVPVLKDHGSSGLTIGMKNLMGVVWERRMWHIKGLDKCIAEFTAYRKPDLTVVDAYRVMMNNGPRGAGGRGVELKKYQVISGDIVAADAAAAKIFGIDPGKIEHIKFAHNMKLGNRNLKELNIRRIII